MGPRLVSRGNTCTDQSELDRAQPKEGLNLQFLPVVTRVLSSFKRSRRLTARLPGDILRVFGPARLAIELGAHSFSERQ
jgi:hypothetical protein